MGNSQAQIREQIESKFVISEIPSIATKDFKQQDIVVNQRSDGTLHYYFVSNKGVELQSVSAEGVKKHPVWFPIGDHTAPIVHTLILNHSSSSLQKQEEPAKASSLVALFLADNKLSILNGDELRCIKTIQLFAPLEAFKISAIHNLSFTIKEDVLHKAKQQELMDELIQQRTDFTKFFPEIKRNNSVLQKTASEATKSNENDDDDEEQEENKAESTPSTEKNVREKSSSNTSTSSNGTNRRDSKSNPAQEKEKKADEDQANERQKTQVYNEFMKAQYEIFVHSSKIVTKDLLDIVAVSNSGLSSYSKGVVLVGYKCGLIQKVTVEKANIEVDEECIFFNPLNLKPQSELELIVKSSSDGDTVPWIDFNILPLRYVFCVNGAYVIAVHSEAVAVEEGDGNKNLVKTLVYVYEYQNGKKIAYFDASTSGSLLSAFVNTNEVTNRNILFLFDSKNNLNLFNFEKGTFLQSFTMASHLKIIDVRPCFFKKSQMFAKLGDVFTLFRDLPDKLDRSIEGDIFLFFTEDSQILVTQLDYKLQSQTIPAVPPQKETVKKVLNQRALKIIRSKVSCKYRNSAYTPEIDQLVLSGENGQLFQFPNFLASIFYYL